MSVSYEFPPEIASQLATAPAASPSYDIAKRGLDLTLSLLLLLLLAPLLLGIALAIKLDSPGPVLFKQTRLGYRGRPFTMLKFRSMFQDADEAPHREAVRRTALGIRTRLSDGRELYKMVEDSRITRLGGFLRTWSLDELPQLINVLRGEVSLVGPRPALDYELPYYKEWHHRRFLVRPGITGLWQVARAASEDYDDMMRLDVEYAMNHSILRDLVLMFRTIPAIIRDKGAF